MQGAGHGHGIAQHPPVNLGCCRKIGGLQLWDNSSSLCRDLKEAAASPLAPPGAFLEHSFTSLEV